MYHNTRYEFDTYGLHSSLHFFILTLNLRKTAVYWLLSRILQGRVSNPSERGTGRRVPPNYFDPCYRNQTIVLALEEIVGARRSYDI